MSDINDGVSIILNRMESNPEEFFDAHKEGNKWRWMFSENLREVMTEPEKAAIYEGMRKVRRLELTAKAVATVLPEAKEAQDHGIALKTQSHPQKIYKPQGLTTALGGLGK